MTIKGDTKLTGEIGIGSYYLIQRSGMAPVVGILEEATLLHFKFKAIINDYKFTYEDIVIHTTDPTDDCIIFRLNHETIKPVIDDALVAFDSRFTKVKSVVETWIGHIALSIPYFAGNSEINCEYTFKDTTISILQTGRSILILVNDDELFNITPNDIKDCNTNINTNAITSDEFTMLKDRLHEAFQK